MTSTDIQRIILLALFNFSLHSYRLVVNYSFAKIHPFLSTFMDRYILSLLILSLVMRFDLANGIRAMAHMCMCARPASYVPALTMR